MIQSIKRKPRKDVEIQIVNLVDVIFVLLIFFVLTTTFTKDTGIDITKPSAGSSKQLSAEPLLIGLGKDGEIYVNERQMDLTMLQSLLRREASIDANKSIVILSDKSTSMGAVVQILDICNLLGLKKTSVATGEPS